MSDFKEDLLESNLIEEQEQITDNTEEIEQVVQDDNGAEDIISTDNELEDAVNNEEGVEDIPENQPEVNCLALTVKKDYSISIFKNKIKKAIKSSWKVAVSIFVLNFLSSFL